MEGMYDVGRRIACKGVKKRLAALRRFEEKVGSDGVAILTNGAGGASKPRERQEENNEGETQQKKKQKTKETQRDDIVDLTIDDDE